MEIVVFNGAIVVEQKQLESFFDITLTKIYDGAVTPSATASAKASETGPPRWLPGRTTEEGPRDGA